MTHRFVASITATLVLALAAFTGTSLAGNGHGNGGNSDHGAQQTQTTPAPTPTPAPAAPAPAAQKQHGNPHQQSSPSPSNPATVGDNSHGVKPSSSTQHDTHAKASSDQTKQYGNGQTAGQIATQAGHGNDTLHGPGNSQPHKTMCGGHEVDVHALKAKGAKCGTSTPSASTATPATPAKPAKHEKHGKPEHPSKPEQPAAPQTPQTPQAPSQGNSANAHEHVTICHATGSATNPYVQISPSASGVFHGHLGHQDGRDIIPPFTYDGQTYSENWDAAHQAIYNAGCAAPAQSQTQGTETTQAQTTAQPCGTTTQSVTEQVLVGVKHFIGPKGSGRYVIIHPSTHSAHYTGKHPDDQPIYETVTRTIDVPSTNCSSSQTQQTQTVTVTTASSTAGVAATTTTQTQTQTPAPSVQVKTQTAPAHTATAAGGVKGATATLTPRKKASGGVLGTTTRLGHAVTGSKLPFTGLPLWIFVAVAAALILTGVAVRRSAADRI